MQTAAGAAKAYAALQKLANPAESLAKTQDAGGQNFGALLKDAMGQVTQAARTTDAQAQTLAVGKANVVDVVTAVAESETAVETLVAVRDRVIAAYEEIMRMPI
ncbi:flagellar hook-basal body complex protein FliE [Pseudorhodoplanes sp.]|uniref:flagellar hook-basal body complex protein FliE n=1 Tax=Pseudorhodoplanes sp. TaxID=1934341 RepID=UPI002B9F4EE0|nr:flagellar hook-basal body complex protein FliE [Pseudorhodoplanes sp.]HWV51553.1 flagellar hook-basal body complex protein FliE [Pseudorhodoplanes sp.]